MNYPLTQIHPNAMPAAKVAYCTGQQSPSYFWLLADWLFANQSQWQGEADATATIKKQAVSLGADSAKLDACVAAPTTQTAIENDVQKGSEAGVSGTPAFFVNDWFINGAVPFDEFKDKIAKAEAGQHPAPTPTPLPEGVQPYDVDPNRPGLTYDGSPTTGDAKAPVVLISFADFKCEYCASFAKDIEPALRDKYVKNGQMRIVWKYLPINAPKAAVASSCAADQGKFWEYHDLLFSKQSEWKDEDAAALTGYAKSLGLDEAKFQKCLADAPGQTHIDEDAGLAQQLGIQGAPYFLLLNVAKQTGLRVPGYLPLDQFEKQVDQVLNPPPTPAASGPSAKPASPTATPAQ